MAPGPDSTYRRLVPIFVGQALGLACGVAGIRLTSTLVPPDVLGRYNVFLTFTPVGMWVLYSGLVKFTGRHWAGAPDQRRLLARVSRACLRKLPWLLLFSAAAATLLRSLPWWLATLLLFGAAALLSVATVAQSALQAARRHWEDAAVIGVGAASRSFLPPLLFAALGLEWTLYGGFAAHTLLFAGAALLVLHRFLRIGVPGAETPPVPAVYEGPLFIGLAVAGWVLLSLPRWLAAVFFGPVVTGYFSLASNIATLVPAVLATVFLLYLQPSLFAAGDSKRDRELLARRIDRAALLHAALAVAGLLTLHRALPWLIGPLIDPRYAAALQFVLPAGAFALSMATGQFYHALLLAAKRESACAPVELTAAGVLAMGSVVAAWVGETTFTTWLQISPAVPWLINRPLARRYVLATH